MKGIIKQLCIVIALVAIPTGCGIFNSSKSQTLESPTDEAETGIDISREPVGAIFKALELGKDLRNIDIDNIEERESVEPVSFKDLMEYLPTAPSGWTAREPEGESNSFGNYSISQVSRSYTQDDKRMKVSIFDWAFNSALYTPFLLSTEFSRESTSGYNKGIKIDNMPGREEYTYQSRKGSLNLLVNSRFLVQIDGFNIEEEELRQWWQLVERRSLTKVNSQKTSSLNLWSHRNFKLTS